MVREKSKIASPIQKIGGAFCVCVRQAGRIDLEVKVLYRPDREAGHWTARASTVRWSLKEAAGKTLVWRSEIGNKSMGCFNRLFWVNNGG